MEVVEIVVVVEVVEIVVVVEVEESCTSLVTLPSEVTSKYSYSQLIHPAGQSPDPRENTYL